MVNRAGSLRANLSGEAVYDSFLPSPLPPDPPIFLDDEAIRLLAHARAESWHPSDSASPHRPPSMAPASPLTAG